VKNRRIYKIKKFILLGIFFLFTNFLSILLFKKVDLKDINIINKTDLISINEIIKNSSLKLPTRLIFIKTKLIEKELKQNIFLKKISLTRKIIPFGLGINLQTREPIAVAEREENGIRIKGFVDIDGVFVEKKYLPERVNIMTPIKIYGWKEDYKKLISLILKTYEDIDDLKVIKISSEGFITLEEKFLQKIFLGFQTPEIEEKLNLIFDIKEQIKKQDIPQKFKSLDLTDLTNPKIKVFIP